VAGVDHVGLGSDFDGIPDVPQGLEGVDRYPALLAELMRRRWTDTDVAKVTGANVLRVLVAAEQVAAKLRVTRKASEAALQERTAPMMRSVIRAVSPKNRIRSSKHFVSASASSCSSSFNRPDSLDNHYGFQGGAPTTEPRRIPGVFNEKLASSGTRKHSRQILIDFLSAR